MKTLNVVTLVLLIVGGLNWGMVGVAKFDLVAALFGAGSSISNLIYILVGAAALYQTLRLTMSDSSHGVVVTTR